MKKKERRTSLTEKEVLKIIREQNRNLKATAEVITLDYFMKTPDDELPTQELEKMHATIDKIRMKLSELLWCMRFLKKLECYDFSQDNYFGDFFFRAALEKRSTEGVKYKKARAR